MRLYVRLLVAVALLLSFGGITEAAKPCPRYPFSLPQADIVVVGRIRAWPVPGVVIIEADRYYRGTGPHTLIAQPIGAQSIYLWRTHWSSGPRSPGQAEVFAFHRGEGIQWTRALCDAWAHLDEDDMDRALAGLAPGTAPEPGVGLHSTAVFTTPAWLAGLGLAVFGWVRWRKWRKRQRGTNAPPSP